ncbi:hypothetical protein, partial [Pseudomonas lactis]|uniref:hypothetical protein n=1 Tax=Pseudomonas lactis TaxID=1615674 RepID=UPI0019D6D0B6
KQIKIKSGSLRIVVTVCCYSLQSCVDTEAAMAANQSVFSGLAHRNRRQASSHFFALRRLQIFQSFKKLKIYLAHQTLALYIHLANYLARKCLALKHRGTPHANALHRSSHRHWRP